MMLRRDIRYPESEEDAKHLRTLAGRMMQHHVRAPWWNLRLKFETYVGARSYALRSMDRNVR